MFRIVLCVCLVRLLSGLSFIGAEADQARNTFKIGAIVPLTGPLADYGQAIRTGFTMARADFPHSFEGVEIIYQDSSYDGKASLNAFNALFARGDINLYYVWGVTPNETLLPILSARGLPVVSETTLKASMVGRPLAVRMAPTGEMTARVLADAVTKLGYRKLGVLMVDIPYYRDIYDSLETALRKSRIKLDLVDTIPLNMDDLRTEILKVRARGYDAVGVFLLNDQVVSYYRQAKALKFLVPTFGAGIHDSQVLISSAGEAAEGAIFVGYDVSPEFRRRWLAINKDDSREGCGANAYDTAAMLAEIFGDERAELAHNSMLPKVMQH